MKFGENMLAAFIEQHKLPEQFECIVEKHFQPLADCIAKRSQTQDVPYFVGINGCQGSGKSTFTDYIAQYLTAKYQLNVIVMSLDDFYLPSKKREQLADNVHPLLATRGVPGTHDIAALKATLAKLSVKDTGFKIPRFNKATDEPFPEEQWLDVQIPADIILLEGWCWGVKAQTSDQLKAPINELELQHDEKSVWRNYVNQQLKDNYEALYSAMDFWIALQAPSFDCVYKWRLEQEEKLQARNIDLAESKIMTPAQILNFTQYFQRLSVQGSNTISQSADAVFYLDNARNITQLSLKG